MKPTKLQQISLKHTYVSKICPSMWGLGHFSADDNKFQYNFYDILFSLIDNDKVSACDQVYVKYMSLNHNANNNGD